MKILTIESSCDETAAAVIDEKRQVLGSVVASQDALHEQFGGVVPEIASRAHLERMLPVISSTLEKAGITLEDLDAVAVVNTPGLAGSLLVGLCAAKALAVALDIPLVAINHLQAHIYACRMAFGPEVFPCVGLIASGGHSNLYRCNGPSDFTLLGATLDDAAGEAFDKIAAMLGLPYPGGPQISRIAQQGDPKAYPFPRAMLRDKEHLNFSFSGLKTAVRYEIVGPGKADFSKAELSEEVKANIAAAAQDAIVDCLVGKSILATEKTGIKTLCVGGGVAANGRLREKLADAAEKNGVKLYIAPNELCTDNAVMGAIALERLEAGLLAPLEIDITAGRILAG